MTAAEPIQDFFAPLPGLTGKVVVVTGSSSGIGEATIRLAAMSGAKVVVNSSSSVEAGNRLADEIGRDRATYVQADVSSEEGAAAIAAHAVATFGGIDILVNNAGTTVLVAHRDFDKIDVATWKRILDVNVIGTWLVTMACLDALKASGSGSVVNVTSLAGLRQVGSSIPYSTSKAALNHLTQLIAKQIGPTVRMNAVAPGLVATPWTADWADQHAGMAMLAPLKRSATSEDVAHAILSIAVNTYITGAVLPIDGGAQLVL
jgi:ketoreductase RED2